MHHGFSLSLSHPQCLPPPRHAAFVRSFFEAFLWPGDVTAGQIKGAVIGLCQVDEGVVSVWMPPSLCLHERLLHLVGFVSRAVMRKATDKSPSVLQHLLTDSFSELQRTRSTRVGLRGSQ